MDRLREIPREILEQKPEDEGKKLWLELEGTSDEDAWLDILQNGRETGVAGTL
jgi:hypothetical protein